jgi:hypothetical protein
MFHPERNRFGNDNVLDQLTGGQVAIKSALQNYSPLSFASYILTLRLCENVFTLEAQRKKT